MSSINNTPAQINPMGLNFIPMFPRELVHQTFKHLDFKSFLNSREVCKGWKTALDINELWKHFFEQKFIPVYNPTESDFKDLYNFSITCKLRLLNMSGGHLHQFTFPKPVSSFIAGTNWVAGYEESGKIIHIQDTSHYSRPWELNGHTDELTALLFHEKILVSGDLGGTLKTWNLNHKCSLHSIQAHNDSISCLTTKGMYLFTGCLDGTVKMWNMITFDNLKTQKIHTDGLSALSVWNDKIVSISTAGEIVIWDPKQDTSSRLNPEHNTLQQSVKNIFATATIAGDYFFAGPVGDRLQRWNLRSRKLEIESELTVTDISVLKYSQSLLISGDGHGIVTFWDPLTFKVLGTKRFSNQEIRSIELTPCDFFINGGKNGDKIIRSSFYHKRKRQG